MSSTAQKNTADEIVWSSKHQPPRTVGISTFDLGLLRHRLACVSTSLPPCRRSTATSSKTNLALLASSLASNVDLNALETRDHRLHSWLAGPSWFCPASTSWIRTSSFLSMVTTRYTLCALPIPSHRSRQTTHLYPLSYIWNRPHSLRQVHTPCYFGPAVLIPVQILAGHHLLCVPFRVHTRFLALRITASHRRPRSRLTWWHGAAS